MSSDPVAILESSGFEIGPRIRLGLLPCLVLKKCKMDIVVLSFIFDKFCLIMD